MRSGRRFVDYVNVFPIEKAYLCWFNQYHDRGNRGKLGKWLDRPEYVFFGFSAPVTCTYLRSRLGTHNLQMELGRWQDCRPAGGRVINGFVGAVTCKLLMMSAIWCLSARIWNDLELGSICKQLFICLFVVYGILHYISTHLVHCLRPMDGQERRDSVWLTISAIFEFTT